ncbi:MAG: YraN family protein [Alphaproteobacteria bacterium]|nr:YraN family protein [Alphaproteobacteria bacterium]
MTTADQKGRLAEGYVRQLLQKKGYEILAHRYKCKHGEIDFLALDFSGDGKTLVAIEVKYRKTFDDAAESITLRQQQRIKNSVLDYLSRLSNNEGNSGDNFSSIRFDVVLLCKTKAPTYIENAWQVEEE